MDRTSLVEKLHNDPEIDVVLIDSPEEDVDISDEAQSFRPHKVSREEPKKEEEKKEESEAQSDADASQEGKEESDDEKEQSDNSEETSNETELDTEQDETSSQSSDDETTEEPAKEAESEKPSEHYVLQGGYPVQSTAGKFKPCQPILPEGAGANAKGSTQALL